MTHSPLTTPSHLSTLATSPRHPSLTPPSSSQGFAFFYTGINLGALIAPLVCGGLQNLSGYDAGFGAAGVGMVVGLVSFLGGEHHLPTDRTTPSYWLTTPPAVELGEVVSESLPLRRPECGHRVGVRGSPCRLAVSPSWGAAGALASVVPDKEGPPAEASGKVHGERPASSFLALLLLCAMVAPSLYIASLPLRIATHAYHPSPLHPSKCCLTPQ